MTVYCANISISSSEEPDVYSQLHISKALVTLKPSFCITGVSVMARNRSLKIWPDRHSGRVSTMSNILFMEKPFTEKYSKQNLFFSPFKEQFRLPASANWTDCMERTNLRTLSPESSSSAKRPHMLNNDCPLCQWPAVVRGALLGNGWGADRELMSQD